MSHFIVIYDRMHRFDAEVVHIDDPDEAVRRLFEIETELRDDSARGVVLLVAEDEETMRATHSHYFKSFDELLGLVDA